MEGKKISKCAMTRIVDTQEETTSPELKAAIDAMFELPLQEYGLLEQFADLVEEIANKRLRKTGNR